MTKLTIHLHSKHYLESGLPLQEYIIVMMYEQKNDWLIKELADFIGVSERTVTRMRVVLVEQGYLVKTTRKGNSYDCTFKITDKLFPEKKNVVTPAV